MDNDWKKRCDDNHLGHFVMDYLRKGEKAICQIDAATGEEETGGSMLSRSIRLAQCFGKLGLVPGDPIVVAGRNHLDVHIPFYAGMMSGQPIAGLEPNLKCNELKHFLNIVKPKIVFCEYTMCEEYYKAMKELNFDTKIVTFGGGENSFATFMDTNRDLQPEHEFKVAAFNTDEVYCWLVSTSGTSGKPKIVALTHSHILHTYKNDYAVIPKMTDGERRSTLNLSSLHWLSGCLNALVMPINHTKVQTSAPVTTKHVIDIINKYKPLGVVCTPTLVTPILQNKKRCDLTCFDYVSLGGSKAHSELLTGLRTRIRPDAHIRQGYGMSEAGGLIIYVTENSQGKLFPKYEAKLIAPETGKEILEPNVTGELFVRGPVMACYYNNPQETKEVVTDDGFLKTGDLFYKDEHGNYSFVERLKMLLKYKNYQVVPLELEEVILHHPGVADVCVTGVPHAQDGEHAVACVVRKPGAQVTEQDIKDLVAKELSAAKHLHGGVMFLESLPITATGKVARAEVKKLVLAAHESEINKKKEFKMQIMFLKKLFSKNK